MTAISVCPAAATNMIGIKLKPCQGGKGLTCEAMIAVAPPAFTNTHIHHDNAYNQHMYAITFINKILMQQSHGVHCAKSGLTHEISTFKHILLPACAGAPHTRKQSLNHAAKTGCKVGALSVANITSCTPQSCMQSDAMDSLQRSESQVGESTWWMYSPGKLHGHQ